jgi:hypothetical protein
MTLVGYAVLVGVPVISTAWVELLGFTEEQVAGGRGRPRRSSLGAGWRHVVSHEPPPAGPDHRDRGRV